jgi:hypothetical protein
MDRLCAIHPTWGAVNSETLGILGCIRGRFAERTGDESYLRYARLHADIIARFGRFPHRNLVLGRI